MAAQLFHFLFQMHGNFLNLADALHHFMHNLRAGFGTLLGVAGSAGSIAGVPGHFLHRGVHFVHGRGRFGKMLRGLGSGSVRLLNLGGKLGGGGGNDVHHALQLSGRGQHAFPLGVFGLAGSVFGAAHGFLGLFRGFLGFL